MRPKSSTERAMRKLLRWLI